MSQNEAAAAGPPSAVPSSNDDDGGESELNTIDMNLHSPAHHPQQSSYRLHTPTHSVIDEDSNRFFMSEPSFSEDGDASSGQVIRAPQPARLFGRHNSSDEDEPQQRIRGRRQRSPYRSAPTSPGNTSLSSWDSPGPGKVKNLIHVQFVPPNLPSADNSTTGSYNPRFLPPTHSSSIDDDRKQLPPMPLPPPTPPHRESSDATDVDSYFLRQLQYATSDPSTRTPGSLNLMNNYDHDQIYHGSFVLRDDSHQRMSSAADESIAMTLSDSSADDNGDAGNGVDNSASLEFPSLSSASHVVAGNSGIHHGAGRSRPTSAAKQRTLQRPSKHSTAQRQQQQQSQTLVQKDHRRLRSGDAVAAKIATGRQEWKGMRSSKIYMPMQEDDDGDDEEEDRPLHKKPEVIARRSSKGQQKLANGVPAQQETTFPVPVQQDQQQSAEGTAEIGFMQAPPVSERVYYGTLSSQQQPQSTPPGAPASSWPPHMSPLPPTSYVGGSTRQMYPQGHKWSSDSVEEFPLNHQPESALDAGDDDYAFAYSGDDNDQPVTQGRVHFASNPLHFQLDKSDVDVENPHYLEKIRASPGNSPFANIGKKSAEKAKRATFLPQHSFGDQEGKNYHFYVCPRCKTRQREFFTVNDAPRQLEGPGSYLALYFSIYVISSLFIFGLEEGWETGDCIYFAVVTLTTAGLGDFVPTSSANKIICSIFIYFGVACIGLLLGTYIAGMLDDRVRRDRKDKLIESCPNCARLETIKEASCRSRHVSLATPVTYRDALRLQKFSSERAFDTRSDHTAILSEDSKHRSPRKHTSRNDVSPPPDARADGSPFHDVPSPSAGALQPIPLEHNTSSGSESLAPGPMFGQSPASSTSKSSYHIGSPITRSILDRQGHTRHDSIDFTNQGIAVTGTPNRVRRMSHDNIQTPTISESIPLETPLNDRASEWLDDEDASCSGDDSVSTTDEIVDENVSKIKAIQYVFLTLRQALVNSMVIIAVGCFGFWFIEGFSVIDSWYFTTVFLTTVG